jgi:hypothetical protein
MLTVIMPNVVALSCRRPHHQKMIWIDLDESVLIPSDVLIGCDSMRLDWMCWICFWKLLEKEHTRGLYYKSFTIVSYASVWSMPYDRNLQS